MTPPSPHSLAGSERIVLGFVTGVVGRAGELRVRIAGDGPEHLLEAETVWLGKRADDPEAKRRSVVACAPARPGEVRLTLEGIERREQAQPLVGLLVTASSEILPPLPEGDFYWFELIGCRVESESGEYAGTVREIWETGAHDVLVVQDDDGVRRLIPTAAELMKSVDLEAERIVVVDLPGLLEPA